MSRINVPYFVSYAHKDSTNATKLVEALDANLRISGSYAFAPWRDTNILAGEHWDAEIHQAMADCRFGLLLLSPAFFASEYIVTQELARLLSSGKMVIPVLLEPLDFKRQDLQSVQELQIFTHEGKSFRECRLTETKLVFAKNLYGHIEDRLKKVK